MYSALAGYLWSMLIAVYLLVLIISKRQTVAKALVPLLYLIGWGLPLINVIVFAVKKYLGYEPILSLGTQIMSVLDSYEQVTCINFSVCRLVYYS